MKFCPFNVCIFPFLHHNHLQLAVCYLINNSQDGGPKLST